MSNEINKKTAYTLRLNNETYTELQRIAEKQDTTVLELIKKSINLLKLTIQLQETGTGSLLIKRGENTQEIILI